MEITAQNRSLAYECFLLYEVLTKRIPALEDIRKGLASVRVQGITLLDLLRIHPNPKEHVFPQYNDIVDITMFKMAVEFEESDREAEKQARVFLETYIDDVARRGIFSFNLFLDQYLNITITTMLPRYKKNFSLETTYAAHFAVHGQIPGLNSAFFVFFCLLQYHLTQLSPPV